MWHVKAEIAPAILLVVDFGGWYKLDSRTSNGSSSEMIQHTQVSLLKDVIVPYTHLLPRLHLSENRNRQTLLYFKGAKHRHRVSTQFLRNYFKCSYQWLIIFLLIVAHSFVYLDALYFLDIKVVGFRLSIGID